ncbi:MAG: hypothetical protein J3K34DRAFT_488759 [Monoraphidium minutum]|nr:MAG: hypothetical protein J3K34DRAFT_488759 [Monoraphidium minutum]
MATTVVPTSFKVLVKMVASAFYGGMCPPLEAMPAEERERAQKPANDTTGLGRVLLAALTEEAWVKEDDLARRLNLQPKMVRRTLRYLEQEQLLQREHRKETKRQQKKEAAALEKELDPEDEEQLKAQVVSYCALDYPRLVDMLRYRLETMKRNVKKACENKEVVQKYRCTNDMCAAEFRSLDVDKLEMNFDAGTFSCSICGSDIDQLIGADSGVGYTGSTAERRAYVARMQEINKVLDEQVKPLRDQLAVCVGQQVPDFNTFQVWMTERFNLQQHERRLLQQHEDQAKANRVYGGGGYGGGGLTIDTYNANMQVHVAFEDEPSTSAAAGVGAAAAAPAAGAAPAAAGGGAAAGVGAKAGGGGAGKKAQVRPPWLARPAGVGGPGGGGGGGGGDPDHDLDAAIAAIEANPALSSEDKQRHVAFQTQLAAARAAAGGAGKGVPVPWLQPKLGGGGQPRPGPGAAGAVVGGDEKGGLLDGGPLVDPVKQEPGGPPPPIKPERGAGPPAAAAAAGGGGGGGGGAPPAKRQRLELAGQLSARDLDMDDAPPAPPGGGGGGASGAAAAAAAPAPAAAAAAQQHEDDDEEEWEDV